MQFRVGPFLYRIKTVAGYIRHQGSRCLGLCDNDQHELLISDQASDTQQIQIICHEYMEAWLYHFGQTHMGKEAYCDLFGVAMTQFIIDLLPTLQTHNQHPPDPQHLLHYLTARLPAASKQTLPRQAKRAKSPRPITAQPQTSPPADRTATTIATHRWRVTESIEPPRPGSPRPWRVRVFEPINPAPVAENPAPGP